MSSSKKKPDQSGNSSGFGFWNPLKEIADMLPGGRPFERSLSESAEHFHILTIGHTINMLEYIEMSKQVG